MSIFRKDCPQCAAANNAEAKACRCGYRFDVPAQDRTITDTLKHLAQEEALYLEYLGARVAQAEAELTAAQGRHASEPGSHTRAADMLVAQQALSAARAEFAAHRERLRAAASETHAGQKKERPASPTHVRPATHSSPAKPLPAAVPPKKQPAAAQPITPPPARAALPAARPAKTAPAAATPVMAATASPAFQAAQAARAQKIMRPSEPRPVPAAAIERSANHGAPRLLARANTKDCPHCTASVPIDTRGCRCGYNFSTSTAELPSLSLGSDFASFFSDLTIIGNQG